jgi:hypothetical protein
MAASGVNNPGEPGPRPTTYKIPRRSTVIPTAYQDPSEG